MAETADSNPSTRERSDARSRKAAEGVIRRFGPRIVVGVGLVSSLATIGLTAREVLNLNGPGWSIAFAVFTCLLAGACVVGLGVLQWWHHVDNAEREVSSHHRLEDQRQKLRADHEADTAHLKTEIADSARARRLALAMDDIHMAFHMLRDADACIRGEIPGGQNLEIYHPKLVESLKNLAGAWTTIVGGKCRVVVKELARVGATASEAEISRSDSKRDFEVRYWVRSEPTPHPENDRPSPLPENSDFSDILDQAENRRWFLAADLDLSKGYRNPHRRPGQDHDYNASMVWPIQRKIDEQRVRLIGFLCVDSHLRGVFSESDFHLGAAYADSLYSLLQAEQSLRPLPTTPVQAPASLPPSPPPATNS